MSTPTVTIAVAIKCFSPVDIEQVLALGLSCRNMLLHARHYNFPRTQKYIFRILFVVPVYAICSGIAIIAST